MMEVTHSHFLKASGNYPDASVAYGELGDILPGVRKRAFILAIGRVMQELGGSGAGVAGAGVANTLRRSVDLEGIPNGLWQTPSSGRSETAIPKSSDPSLEYLLKALKGIYPDWNWGNLPEGLVVVAKGRGAMRDYTPNSEHFAKRKAIIGFTAKDTMDIEVAEKLAGCHEVLDSAGDKVQHHYIPARIVLGTFPIEEITYAGETTIPTEANNWKEPLCVEIIWEIGRFNFQDMESWTQQGKVGFDWIMSEMEQALALHPMFKDWFKRNKSGNKSATQQEFVGLYIEKMWRDSQVEARYLIIGDNRSLQNTSFMGSKDWDDSSFRDTPMVDGGGYKTTSGDLYAIKLQNFIVMLAAAKEESAPIIAAILREHLSLIDSPEQKNEVLESIAFSAGGLGEQGAALLVAILKDHFKLIESPEQKNGLLESIIYSVVELGAKGAAILNTILEEYLTEFTDDQMKDVLLDHIASSAGGLGEQGAAILGTIYTKYLPALTYDQNKVELLHLIVSMATALQDKGRQTLLLIRDTINQKPEKSQHDTDLLATLQMLQ